MNFKKKKSWSPTLLKNKLNYLNIYQSEYQIVQEQQYHIVTGNSLAVPKTLKELKASETFSIFTQ